MAPMAMNPDSLVLTVDYTSGSPMEDDSDKSIAKGGVTTPFPWKLHDMLDDMARNGDHSVVTWQPHGRAFMVHKPKEFVEDIMPKYFNQTKYASFQRQLNLYGFSRLCHGDDKGAYYHMCFVRGKRNLCRNMVRQKIKGTKVRRSLAPDEEPNFYQPQWETSKGERGEDPKSVIDEIPHSPHQSSERQIVQLPQPSSVVANEAMTDAVPPAPSLAVAPSKAVPEPQVSNHPENTMSLLNSGAKGGDLLFFEGQPFRYLEHIEKLPPPVSKGVTALGSNPRPPLRPMGQWNPQEESVTDMIDSIISSETTGTGGGEYSVCCV
eukprot:Nitzschia sp. Nitz4//scaffold86_size83305//51020//52056//NITZ4_005265-RA/size83305-snap-gene-0.172-mRNA-1//-1//CDS//3329559259//2525//frame0